MRLKKRAARIFKDGGFQNSEKEDIRVRFPWFRKDRMVVTNYKLSKSQEDFVKIMPQLNQHLQTEFNKVEFYPEKAVFTVREVPDLFDIDAHIRKNGIDRWTFYAGVTDGGVVKKVDLTYQGSGSFGMYIPTGAGKTTFLIQALLQVALSLKGNLRIVFITAKGGGDAIGLRNALGDIVEIYDSVTQAEEVSNVIDGIMADVKRVDEEIMKSGKGYVSHYNAFCDGIEGYKPTVVVIDEYHRKTNPRRATSREDREYQQKKVNFVNDGSSSFRSAEVKIFLATQRVQKNQSEVLMENVLYKFLGDVPSSMSESLSNIEPFHFNNPGYRHGKFLMVDDVRGEVSLLRTPYVGEVDKIELNGVFADLKRDEFRIQGLEGIRLTEGDLEIIDRKIRREISRYPRKVLGKRAVLEMTQISTEENA